jgi:hypothetical protein
MRGLEKLMQKNKNRKIVKKAKHATVKKVVKKAAKIFKKLFTKPPTAKEKEKSTTRVKKTIVSAAPAKAKKAATPKKSVRVLKKIKTAAVPPKKNIAATVKKNVVKPAPKTAKPVLLKKQAAKKPEKTKPAVPVSTQASKPVVRRFAGSRTPIMAEKKPAPMKPFRPARRSASQRRRPSVRPLYFFKTDLPQSYGETYIRAMQRDPEWIFVYWEMSGKAIDDIRNTMGQADFESSKRVLRLLDVTGVGYNGTNALSSFDIEISGFANNWYIKVPQSGRTYVVEYGCINARGRHILFARSNPVSVARGTVSDIIDDRWSSIQTDTLMNASRGTRPLGASERLQEQTQESGAGMNDNMQLQQAPSSLFPGSSEINAQSSFGMSAGGR